jgi:hypothetical protein
VVAVVVELAVVEERAGLGLEQTYLFLLALVIQLPLAQEDPVEQVA